MALKKEHKIMIGVGLGVAVVTTIGVVMYRNRKSDTVTEDADELAEKGDRSGIPTTGTERITQVPLVSRPFTRPNNSGGVFGIPTVSRPTTKVPVLTSDDGSTWSEFSKAESIVATPDGRFTFMFKTKPNVGFLKAGQSVYISGTDRLFDGFTRVNDLIIVGDKITGIFISPKPTGGLLGQSTNMRRELENPNRFRGIASIQKQD